MLKIKFLRDYNFGSVSDPQKYVRGQVVTCVDARKGRDLIIRGIAVKYEGD